MQTSAVSPKGEREILANSGTGRILVSPDHQIFGYFLSHSKYFHPQMQSWTWPDAENHCRYVAASVPAPRRVVQRGRYGVAHTLPAHPTCTPPVHRMGQEADTMSPPCGRGTGSHSVSTAPCGPQGDREAQVTAGPGGFRISPPHVLRAPCPRAVHGLFPAPLPIVVPPRSSQCTFPAIPAPVPGARPPCSPLASRQRVELSVASPPSGPGAPSTAAVPHR